MRTTNLMLVLALVPILVSCQHEDSRSEQSKTMSEKSIEQIMQAHTAEWMKVPGVVGVGIGEADGKPCIKIFASHRTPEITSMIPDSVDGARVVLQVTGEFEAHGDST